MAPDSRLWRHLLGESTTDFQQILLIIASMFILVAALFPPYVQARTEPVKGSQSESTSVSLSYERQTQGSPLNLAPLSIPSELFSPSPAVPGRQRIQIPINQPQIQKYIRFYEGEGRATFEDAMERARHYAPLMTEILESHDVPAEMLSIVFVESRFKRNASYRGADGYWQLLAPTARAMGLRVDRWVDERRDPIKSTKAAARYLRSLHKQYDSWTLALAAYNSGAGPVSSAVRKHRGHDVWELSRRGCLPARTRAYVPKVMAAMKIMREPEKHGFKRPEYFPPSMFDPTWVRTPLELERISRWIGVPVSQLQDLNPSLRQNRVPDSGFALRLPSGARETFELAYESFLRK